MNGRQRLGGGTAASGGVIRVRGTGTFTVLLSVVLVLFLGGMWMADRLLTSAGRAQVSNDAQDVSVLLADAIEDHRRALRDARGALSAVLPADDTLTRRRILRRQLPVTQADWPTLVRYWVTDADGRVIVDTALSAGGTRVSVTEHAAIRGLVEAAQRSGDVQLGIVPEGRVGRARELVLVEPLVEQGEIRGTAAALFPATELLAAAARSHPPSRVGLLVLRGADTVVVLGAPGSGGEIEHASADVQMPGGALWRAEVQHRIGGQATRRGLWTLSLLGALLLAVGLMRERRQAVRVAERSAELERLSSELLRANRMKSEFLANVSHELRTPLNAIVGFVELLRDGVYGALSPRQVQPVERIAASATHLRHLVDQVLDIAKIAAGRLEVHPETIVLRPFVLNVASELESLTSEKGLSLSITVGASLPRVRTDPQHLRQILVNLIGNAVKYTEAGGVVVRARLVLPRSVKRTTPDEAALQQLSPDQERPWVALQVTDTGIGIAEEDFERVFDEFEQVNAGPRGDSMNRGTGLGLAISRRLARLLDGEITLESTERKGSTFTLWLPVSPGEEVRTTA